MSGWTRSSQRLISDFGGHQFGKFRATLLNLFSACSYEQNIVASANRLITRDVFAAVLSNYQQRRGAQQVQPKHGSGSGGGAAGTSGSSSSTRRLHHPAHHHHQQQQQQQLQNEGQQRAASDPLSSAAGSVAHLGYSLGLLGRAAKGNEQNMEPDEQHGGSRGILGLLPQPLSAARLPVGEFEEASQMCR
jgi:hypothetical protein